MIKHFEVLNTRSSWVNWIQNQKGNFIANLGKSKRTYVWPNIHPFQWLVLSDHEGAVHNNVPHDGVGSRMWEMGMLYGKKKGGVGQQEFQILQLIQQKLYPTKEQIFNRMKQTIKEEMEKEFIGTDKEKVKMFKKLDKATPEQIEKIIKRLEAKGGLSFRKAYIQFRKWKKRIRGINNPATVLAGFVKTKKNIMAKFGLFRWLLKRVPIPAVYKMMFLMLTSEGWEFGF